MFLSEDATSASLLQTHIFCAHRNPKCFKNNVEGISFLEGSMTKYALDNF